ncbi:MAG: NAD(P)H-binding protein [Anaerolineae bacterium]|nr:NAD(P)H-binding protein [Anaerolineae bacterium]
MTRILITGGRGLLGREIVSQLAPRGDQLRIMSRSPKPANIPYEWAQANLASGEGLAEAVAGVDTIVHAASSPFNRLQQTDVEGTRQLLKLAEKAGVKHIVYISIVGIDHIDFFYYHGKLATEKVIKSQNVPWSILRATQFHDFVHMLMQPFTRLPLWTLPLKWQFQTIDKREAAQRMVELVDAGPSGAVPDIGGPQIVSLREMAAQLQEVRGIHRPMINLPIPGGLSTGLHAALNTVPSNRYGHISWLEWIQEQYAQPLAYRQS